MTPSGIEPATFRFVAQYLNHCATNSGPLWKLLVTPKFGNYLRRHVSEGINLQSHHNEDLNIHERIL
jgi:hypothetical protein